jgi:hypothetical protein
MKIGDVVELKTPTGGVAQGLVTWVGVRADDEATVLKVATVSPHPGDVGRLGRSLEFVEHVPPAGDQPAGHDSDPAGWRYVQTSAPAAASGSSEAS